MKNDRPPIVRWVWGVRDGKLTTYGVILFWRVALLVGILDAPMSTE